MFLFLAGPAKLAQRQRQHFRRADPAGNCPYAAAVFAASCGTGVFLDNEEKGLVGAGAFRQKKNGSFGDVPLLNFDCVGQGSTALFVLPRAMRKNTAVRSHLEASFASNTIWEAKFDSSPFTMFPRSAAVPPGHRRGLPVPGTGVGAVSGAAAHAAGCDMQQQENLLQLAAGSVRLTGRLCGQTPGAVAEQL